MIPATAWSKEEEAILLNNFTEANSIIQRLLEERGFSRSVGSIKKKKYRIKYSPNSQYSAVNEAGVIPGHYIKAISTNYDADGNIRQQWVKTDKERVDELDRLKEAVIEIVKPCSGMSESVKKPTNTIDDLLVAYPIADVHLGLFSWRDETGVDYDMKICEKILSESMSELVESAPATKVCLIANLADFFHSDSMENKTMRSGNILDVDSRWGKIIQVGVRAYRSVIYTALQKHEKVIVKSAIGNHDDHSSLWLAMLMKAYFENNDRVEIELPLSPFSYHVFGKNLIGITHGTIKSDRLPGIMATDKAKEWGTTTYRTFWGGHKHHKEVKEHPGCTVELFRAITAPDAWTHESGYRSTRSMEAVVLKASGGEHGRRVVML